ncbi:hypothetical protein COY43_01785, partial [Candidatus Berkelbacteria bacterium CG_4_10_14_0_8_um_filter_35_9_33_8]
TVNNISCAISPTLSFSSATIAENGSTTLNYNKGSSSSYYQVRRGTSPGSISNAGIILPNQSGSISISAYSPVSHILNTLYYYDLLVNANTTYCNDRNSTDATFKVTPICPTVSSFTIPAIVYKNQTTSASWNINNYYGAVSAQIVVKDNTTGLNIDTVNVASASGTATIDVKKVVYIAGRSYTATLSTTKSGCSGSSLSTTFQVKNPSPTVDTFTATSSINSGEKKVDPITFNWTTTGADNVTIQYRNSSSVWTDLVTNRGADSSYSFTPTTTHIVSNAVKTRIIAKKASAADAIFPQPPDTGRTTSVTAISCVRTPTLSINANTINENGTATLTYNTNGSIASPATAKIERKIWTTGAWGEAFGVTTLSSTANSTKQTYPALTHTFGSTYYYRLLANANTTYCNDKTTADNSVPLTVNKICPTSTAVTLTPSTSNPTGKSVDRDTNLTIGYTVQNAYGDVAYDLKIKEKTGFIKQVLYNLPITASINTATKVATGSYSVIPNTITSLLLNTDYDLIFSASRNSVSCPSVSITQVFRVTVQSPTISSFTANPTSVQIGDDSTKYQSSALNWSATNAETMKIEAYNVTTSSWGLVYTIPSNQFAGGPHSLQPTDSVINRTTKKIQLRVVATRMNALDAIKTLDIPITLVSCPTQAGTTIIADDATIRKPGGTTIRWSSINDPDSIVISYLTPQNTFPRGNAKN